MKTMEVQIKGDQWNKRFRTVQVYWKDGHSQLIEVAHNRGLIYNSFIFNHFRTLITGHLIESGRLMKAQTYAHYDFRPGARYNDFFPLATILLTLITFLLDSVLILLWEKSDQHQISPCNSSTL